MSLYIQASDTKLPQKAAGRESGCIHFSGQALCAAYRHIWESLLRGNRLQPQLHNEPFSNETTGFISYITGIHMPGNMGCSAVFAGWLHAGPESGSPGDCGGDP